METSRLSTRLTRRFVAGLTLDDGLRVCRELNREKVLVTLDHLGENVHFLNEATAAREAYSAALDRIDEEGLQATVSVKLTALGLDLSEHACRENLLALVTRATEFGSRVEMDMESSEYTDQTLSMVREMHHRSGNVRAVIQAYLYRSEEDVEQLSKEGVPVRLCKGAYREPESIAFPRKQDVDRNYIKLMHILFDRGVYPAIASHDEAMVREAIRYTRERGISPDRFEFQMLYGIRRGLQRQLVEQGFRLRLYVPYGAAWYPYFMRRLAERPANLFFLLRNFLRR
jgi:proline dehydrogenase